MKTEIILITINYMKLNLHFKNKIITDIEPEPKWKLFVNTTHCQN